MSKKSVKFMIVDTLENLSSKDLKKFKTSLCERDQEPRVTRRSVEDADEVDLADLLVKICSTESKAMEIAVEILNNIGCKSQAASLATQVSSGSSGSAGYQSKYMAGGQHFVDKHRIALIERFTMVMPILDRLLDNKVITQENYSEISTMRTTFQQMRGLLEIGSIRSSQRGKDCLYEALCDVEPFLMEDLNDM